MTIRTLDYDVIRIVEKNKIDYRFDTLIDFIQSWSDDNVDEMYDIYQLADGEIVAVLVIW